ncbi:MAG: hypothetical protein FWD68_19460, partial [Alphaproteobacteria bacterium]|nr:hypothetical protein [Alphaproteobacteria bacterium]
MELNAFNEFCHIIRAASRIANDTEIVCVGSQAILAQFPDAPKELLVSMELDLYPKQNPADSELVDGAIGYLSNFHDSFGYYADGVDDPTATLPTNWGASSDQNDTPGNGRRRCNNARGSRSSHLIGIGGPLARPPLPHHRTYGSVSGGSTDYAGFGAVTVARPI